jgi:hypothetical protein
MLTGEYLYNLNTLNKGESAMNEKTNELRAIITKLTESGWDLIDTPAKAQIKEYLY